MSKARNEGDRLEITKVLSNMEDIDIAHAAMEYSEKAYVYQAALATASQMLTLSLVDYVAR
jgi:flagellin-like hook-associated protein FlgL